MRLFVPKNNERMITKKKKKKKKNDQGIGHESSLLHLGRLKSQHTGKSSSLSPTYLSSPIMASA